MNLSLKLAACDFKKLLSLGFTALREREDEVNKLNVFPVPDGATGSNMRMTFEAGLSALKGKNAGTVAEVSSLFAKGMLLGARGNSGVILSQIFKGIAVGLEGVEEVSSSQLCSAFECGVDRSYKAVIKPVEGTILTVFREATEAIKVEKEDIPFDKFFEKFVL